MRSLSFNRFPELDYATKEAMNTLCTNLTFMGDRFRRIMITSTNSAEGKSFLSMQIMRTLAELGKCVLLVDADLRRSMIDSRFKVKISEGDKLGVTHYLAGQCEMDGILYDTNIPNAYFVPVGFAVSNSLALLNSPRFKEMLEYFSARMDYVLVDAPPLGILVDAAEIAKSCDGALLVVGYNRVRYRDLAEARLQIERANCTVLGAVLNNVPSEAFASRKYLGRSFHSYAYYPPYTHETEKT